MLADLLLIRGSGGNARAFGEPAVQGPIEEISNEYACLASTHQFFALYTLVQPLHCKLNL